MRKAWFGFCGFFGTGNLPKPLCVVADAWQGLFILERTSSPSFLWGLRIKKNVQKHKTLLRITEKLPKQVLGLWIVLVGPPPRHSKRPSLGPTSIMIPTPAPRCLLRCCILVLFPHAFSIMPPLVWWISMNGDSKIIKDAGRQMLAIRLATFLIFLLWDQNIGKTLRGFGGLFGKLILLSAN